MKRLQALIDSEITFRLEHHVLRRVTAMLGDEMNGFTATKVCGSVEEAVQWLFEQAAKKVGQPDWKPVLNGRPILWSEFPGNPSDSTTLDNSDPESSGPGSSAEDTPG